MVTKCPITEFMTPVTKLLVTNIAELTSTDFDSTKGAAIAARASARDVAHQIVTGGSFVNEHFIIILVQRVNEQTSIW